MSESSAFNLTNVTNDTLEVIFDCRGHLFVTDWLVTKLTFLLLYSSVFVVAISGNSLVIYVVATNKNMQSVTNLFICNLAVSDWLVNCTSLWLTPVYTYMGRWIWGEWLCHGLPLFQGTSIFISTLTLTAIAIDRYIVVIHPRRRRISVNVCFTVIACIWSLSLLLVMPYAVHMRIMFIPAPCNLDLCIELWVLQRLKSIYGMIVMVLQFVVPLVGIRTVFVQSMRTFLYLLPVSVIGFCYVCIWMFIEHRQTMVSSSNRRGTPSMINRKRRLLRMLISMVTVFLLCWFPFNALNIMRDFQLDEPIKPIFSFVFLLAHIISMSATCWNPIIYAWMNENFRREFKAALPCFAVERTASLPSISTNDRPMLEMASENELNLARPSTLTVPGKVYRSSTNAQLINKSRKRGCHSKDEQKSHWLTVPVLRSGSNANEI